MSFATQRTFRGLNMLSFGAILKDKHHNVRKPLSQVSYSNLLETLITQHSAECLDTNRLGEQKNIEFQ